MIGETVSHYRVEQKIGGGGMGVVYRAIDDRLGRPVALKVLPEQLSKDPQATERFQREARAASALNHPNICTIYDVGEFEDDDGLSRAFLAMEFMEGRTLKAHIEGGPLPTEELLELGVQIAEGLAAAHEAGIIHRDLKPANLFLTRHGHAKILDFGLAKLTSEEELGLSPLSDVPTMTSPEPLTEAGVAMGTVAYMSPEQARGEELDHRTDLFSLGTVLYEMATGHQPFAGNTAAVTHDALLNRAPSLPVTLNRELPEELQTVILKCLEKDPTLRYQSAAGLRGDLVRLRRDSEATRAVPVADTTPPAPARRWPAIAAGVVLLAAVASAVAFWPQDPAVALTEADPILLTAFDNRTGDPVFDETLETALAVKIDESPFLNVVSDQRVREVLELMQREPGTRIDEELGREICRRLNLKAMITGEIAALGEQHVVTLHTVGCADGETLARVQREAASKEGVLAALGEASTQLREDLGESLQSVAEFDTPIERATTSSLEALEAYSRGWKIAETEGELDAIPHLERAVAIDQGFAMALRKLAVIASNWGDDEKAMAQARRAFENRERASTPERLYIEASYQSIVTGDTHEQIDALEMLIDTYPESLGALAVGNLGVVYERLGQFSKAAELYDQYWRTATDKERGASNLSRMRYYMGDPEGARELIATLDPASAWAYQVALWDLILAKDAAELESFVDLNAWSPWALYNQGEALAQWGHFESGIAAMTEASARAEARGLPGIAAFQRALTSAVLAEFGNCTQSARIARAALESSRSVAVFRNAGWSLARCGFLEEAEAAVTELSALQPNGTEVQGLWVPLIRASIEIERGNPRQALAVSEHAGEFQLFWVHLERARAHLLAGDARSAEGELRAAKELRLVYPESPLHALVPLYLARARAAQGNVEGARESYDELFDLWDNADPGFPLLLKAQQEYAALGAPPVGATGTADGSP